MSLEALINQAKGKDPIKAAEIFGNPQNDVLRGLHSDYSKLSYEAMVSLGGSTAGISEEEVLAKFRQYLGIFEKITRGPRTGIPDWRRLIEEGQAEQEIRQIVEAQGGSYEAYMNSVRTEGMQKLINDHIALKKKMDLEGYFRGALSHIEIPEEDQKRLEIVKRLKELMPDLKGEKNRNLVTNLPGVIGAYMGAQGRYHPIEP